MTIPTEQEIKAQYQNASKRVQDYVTSQELEDAFHEIRNTHKLHLDEADKLSDAIVSVFLEMQPANEFPKLLSEVLEQNSDKHTAVLEAVNEKIFIPFRKKLAEPDTPEKEAISISEQTPVTKEEVVLSKTKPRTQQTPNKLQDSVRSTPTEVEIQQPTENKKNNVPGGKKSANYDVGADPYLEPIE